MIYLIGGPPRCGKSTLARKLSKELKIAWLSGDTFEGFTKGFFNDRKEYAKYFPKNIIREQTHNSNDEMYSQYSTEEILASYIIQGKVVLHMMEVLIENMILEKMDFILEGYHITPEFVSEMIKKYGEENFRSIFLVKNDYEKVYETLMASKDPEDWVHKKTQDKEIVKKISEFIHEYSKYFTKEADKYNFKYLDYSDSLENHLNEALVYLK